MLRIFTISCLLCLLSACDSGSDAQVSNKTLESKPVVTRQILVTGVTGRQGGAVARALLEKGYQVKGLSRDTESERALAMAALGVDMLKGDFEDLATLDKAMDGVYGVFLVTNFWEHGYESEIQQGKNVADAAARANIKHLVFSSVANADQSTGIPHFDSKYEIEKYIHLIQIPFTVIRPVSFMENWEYAREEILSGKLSSPFSLGSKVQEISVRDIGRFAALAFARPEEWIGRSIDIAGDQFTMKQVLNLFSQVSGSPVEYIQIPWDVYEKSESEEMAIMDRWIDSTGYSANVNFVRSELPDMYTLEDYLYEAGWSSRDR